MKGCLAPSEVPGIESTEASTFGAIAEELIWGDFCMRYSCMSGHVFRDDNNPGPYLKFLAWHNPRFDQDLQSDYSGRLRSEKLMRIPDFLLHTFEEKTFYEVKPDSQSGMAAGVEKVAFLQAAYGFYHLPYLGGEIFVPRHHVIARFAGMFTVKLRVRLAGPGLLVYSLCADAQGLIDLGTLILLLRYVVREANKQRGRDQFRPVDLAPAFGRDQQLTDLARTLGLTFAAASTAAAAVGWKYFWKAVIRRFAVRGATAALLAAADGPLPVGDLVAAGMFIWTIVDIVRFRDELWRDARVLRDQGA